MTNDACDQFAPLEWAAREAEAQQLNQTSRPVIGAPTFAYMEYAVHLEAEIERLRAALEALVDDEPCRFDHEGYCQTHSLGRPCEVATARKLLGRDKLVPPGNCEPRKG